MLNFLLILILIHYIGLFIFGVNNHQLNCGIFGQCTNKPHKINSSNIKILGLLNESRGKHSCGVSIDGEIYHGLEKEKLFSDFIKGRNFRAKKFPLVIGHTRSASIGAAINEHNAHPFGFGTIKDADYEMVGVHNGTLYNHLELAKKYDINSKAMYNGSVTGVELERTKIDSEILLEIIYKTKSFKVLSEYIGKAALVWVDNNNPNVTYFWSGKSRNYESIHSTESEERPMNIWIESKNNFYFSSMPESLEMIGGQKDKVFQIEYNTVYQVVDGDFESAKKFKISRLDCFQNESYSNRSNHYGYGNYSGHSGNAKEGENVTKNVIDLNNNDYCEFTELNKHSKMTPVLPFPETNIYEDRPFLDQNEYKNKIYSYKLRYFQNGHTINGVFCYLPHHGFYKLGESTTEATKRFKEIKGLRFNEGEFIRDKRLKLGSVIFEENSKTYFYYFLKGILLKEAIDYSVLFDNELQNNYESMSHVSKYPIIDFKHTWKNDKNQDILLEGKKFTGSIDMIGCEYIYHILNGNLNKKEIRSNLKKEKIVEKVIETVVRPKPDINILNSALKNIKVIEEGIVQTENLEKMPKQKSDEEITQIIANMVNDEIQPCLMSFQNCREALQLLPANNLKVLAAKTLIADLIQTINLFVDQNE